jgi:DNA repair protein RAD50
MEDKSARLEKLRADLRTAAYEERAAEKQAAGRALEDRRDSLSAELRTLSLQADSRARLDIKRTELRNKKAETENMSVDSMIAIDRLLI